MGPGWVLGGSWAGGLNMGRCEAEHKVGENRVNQKVCVFFGGQAVMEGLISWVSEDKAKH